MTPTTATLPPAQKTLSFFEFWPAWLFYLPLYCYCFYLSVRFRHPLLPTITNPSFPLGGLVGESKAEVLNLLRQHLGDWVAPFVVITRTHQAAQDLAHAQQLMQQSLLTFPIVAKPDIGCRGAGVWLIQDATQLLEYIQRFPVGAAFVLQQYIHHKGEAGVFYVRHPGQLHGYIPSLTLKYFPDVVGDGISTLKQLIQSDQRAGQIQHLYLKRHADNLSVVLPKGQRFRLVFSGNHSKGTIFRDGTSLITSALTQQIDQLAQRIPEFYFGRFDVRFAGLDDLLAGRHFTIIEVNGAGAESTHIWDSDMTLLQAWRALFKQYHHAYAIAADNQKRGFQPATISQLWHAYRREKRLTPLYPHTQ